MNCFSETHLVYRPPTLTVSYLKVDLRTQLFRLSRLIIHAENPATSHLKNLNLLKLSKNKNVIQKSGNGNSVVLIDKIVSTNGIKKLLDNPRQFEKLSINPSKELNFILNCEQKVMAFLMKLKIKIRLMRIYTINYAHLVVQQKSIKRLLMAALLLDQFFQPLGHPRVKDLYIFLQYRGKLLLSARSTLEKLSMTFFFVSI